MPNTVIIGNMCYSGFSIVSQVRHFGREENGKTIFFDSVIQLNPIEKAFENRNLISYYGYATTSGSSLSVTDEFAREMEDSITKRLCVDLDSTGSAHLRPSDGAEFYDVRNDSVLYKERGRHYLLLFRHFGADNYSYCVDSIVDERDGQVYRAVCIGNQNWMAENLRYAAPGSVCYDTLAANCDTYGRLYPWTVAMAGAPASDAIPSGVRGVCPKGWHLPSSGEWMQLMNALGGPNAGGALKSTSPLWDAPNAGASDSRGFAGLPGGSFSVVETKPIYLRSFSGKGAIGIFQSTSVSVTDTTVRTYSLTNTTGLYNTTKFKNPQDPNQPPANASCRCVRDH